MLVLSKRSKLRLRPRLQRPFFLGRSGYTFILGLSAMWPYKLWCEPQRNQNAFHNNQTKHTIKCDDAARAIGKCCNVSEAPPSVAHTASPRNRLAARTSPAGVDLVCSSGHCDAAMVVVPKQKLPPALPTLAMLPPLLLVLPPEPFVAAAGRAAGVVIVLPHCHGCCNAGVRAYPPALPPAADGGRNAGAQSGEPSSSSKSKGDGAYPPAPGNHFSW